MAWRGGAASSDIDGAMKRESTSNGPVAARRRRHSGRLTRWSRGSLSAMTRTLRRKTETSASAADVNQSAAGVLCWAKRRSPSPLASAAEKLLPFGRIGASTA